MKTCQTCKCTKSISDFGKNKSTKDGLQGTCKKCRVYYAKKRADINKVYKEKYYKENKDRLAKEGKLRYDAKSEEREILRKERQIIKAREKEIVAKLKEINILKKKMETQMSKIKKRNSKRVCANPACNTPIEEQRFSKKKSSYDGLASVCKVCKAIKDKEYRSKNKEKIAEGKIRYREENRERYLEHSRNYYYSNIEEFSKKGKLYRASDAGKEVIARNNTKRELQIRETRDGSITSNTLDELFLEQNGTCYICNQDLTQLKHKNVHLDHIIPLTRGGKHTLANVAWSCASCNLRKGDKLLSEFAENIFEGK